MTNYKVIKIYSKDKKSLKQFEKLLKNINKTWKNITFYIKDIKKRRKRITLLKSPHVNKTAQTQFQSIVYCTKIKYFSWDVKKNYIILKKIKNYLFPDIKIKIEQTVCDKKIKSLKKNLFLPKKMYYYKETKTFLNKQIQTKKLLTLHKQVEKKKRILEKTLQFLKVLDNYGNSY